MYNCGVSKGLNWVIGFKDTADTMLLLIGVCINCSHMVGCMFYLNKDQNIEMQCHVCSAKDQNQVIKDGHCHNEFVGNLINSEICCCYCCCLLLLLY